MAEISKLAAVSTGLVENINTSTSDLDVNSLWVGGTSGGGATQLTKTILNNLISYGQTAIDSLTGDVTATGPGAAAASLVATSNATLTTLSALTTATSLVSIGTVTSGTWHATPITEVYGGTGQSSYTTGDTLYASATNTLSKLPIGSTGYVLTVSGGIPTWAAPSTSGTVTSVSVTTANGFAGTVTNPTTTPAITISTTINSPVLAGNGTAISAATTTGSGSTVVLADAPTFAGAVNMGGFQINNMATPSVGSDAATKGYVDSAINGLTWKGPVQAYANSNVPLTGGATLTIDGYSVQNGDLVILANQTIATQNYVYVASGIGTAYTLTQVVGFEAPTAIGDAYLVENGTTFANSAFQVNQITPNVTFIQFAGPNFYTFTAPLALSGNTVSLNYAAGLTTSGSSLVTAQDGSTISINGSNQLYVPTSGITSTQLASASVTTAKLATITDGVTLDQSGAGSTLEIKTAGVGTTQLASASVTASKLGAVTDGITTDQNGPGGTIEVISTPGSTKTMVAGQSFSANTSYMVRFGINANSETTDRVYSADSGSATTTPNFWAIGMASSTTAVSAGQNISVTLLGTFTLGSSDTNFNTSDIGHAVWLTTSGGWSTTAPSTSGSACYKIGVVETVSEIFVDGKQLTGVN